MTLDVYYNVGTIPSPQFADRVDFPFTSGNLRFEWCPWGGSTILLDADGDGDPDLFVDDTKRLSFCENLGGGTFADPIVVIDTSPPNPLRAIEMLGVWDRFLDGRAFLILMPAVGRTTFDEWNAMDFSIREVGWGPNGIELGEQERLTLTGEIGQYAVDVIHIGPGVLSPASGEVFPWELSRGCALVGSGRGVTILDGLGGDMLRFKREGTQTMTPTTAGAQPVQRGVHLQDLTLRSGDRAFRTYRRCRLTMERVRIEGSATGIQLGTPITATPLQEDPLFLRNVGFVSNDVAIDETTSHWTELVLEDCLFDGNRIGLQLRRLGNWKLHGTRFLNHGSAAIDVLFGQSCVQTPCPEWQLMSLDLTSCLFAGNVNHLRITTGISSYSNVRAHLWGCTIDGGGAAFETSGTDHADIAVQSAILWPSGPVIQGGTFPNLDVGTSTVSDPTLAAIPGNVQIAPSYALGNTDGHLLPSSALRGRGADATTLPARALFDIDGEARGASGPTDPGADEIFSPDVVGARFAALGSTYRLTMLGTPSAAAILVLGTETIAGIPLGGSMLQVNPASPTTILLPVALDPRGVASLHIPIPPDPVGLGGSNLFAQGVSWHAASGLETTRLLRFSIE